MINGKLDNFLTVIQTCIPSGSNRCKYLYRYKSIFQERKREREREREKLTVKTLLKEIRNESIV